MFSQLFVLYNFQSGITTYKCFFIALDADLISEKAHKLAEETMIDILAQNIDIFITRLKKKNVCPRDSFSFLSLYLGKLAKLTN